MAAPDRLDSDSDEDGAGGADPVLLGFVQRQTTRAALARDRFPSKVGGLPAWLDPEHVPDAERLRCPSCRRPMRFLAQVYAPVDGVDDAFHRTLFVFCCTDAGCADSPSSVRVLRSQLPRENPYYPSEPLAPLDDDAPSESARGFAADPPYANVRLCVVCGLKAPKSCAGCRRRFYCSRDHQVVDWRAGHCERCADDDALEPLCLLAAFPQFEIRIDDEDDIDVAELSPKEKAMLTHYEAEVDGLQGDDRDEHDKLASFDGTVAVDDVFVEFQQRILRAPSQCVRYQRGAARPLWTHSAGRLPASDALQWRCAACAGPVEFEFQILPQLLAFLGDAEPAFDFGTIAVYTCRDSCAAGPELYREEHAWRQAPAAPM